MATADIASATSPQSPAHTLEFRRHVSQISRQSSVFFLGTVLAAGAGYPFKIYLARVLGAEDLGLYALGMTMVGFLGIFNALGLPQSAVRFVSMYRATGKIRLLHGFLARSTVLLVLTNLFFAACLLMVGPWVAVHFYHAPALGRYLSVFALIMLSGALNALFGQVLAAYKEVSRRTVITTLVATGVTIVLAVGLIALGTGLWGYLVAQVGSAVIVLLMLTSLVWKLTPKEGAYSPDRLARLEPEVISFSLAAFGVGFLEFLMSQSDKIFLGLYLSARAVGIYAVAAGLVAFVPIVLQSINQIFAPTIADLHTRGERELLGRIFQILTKWSLGLTAPLAAVIIIFAHPFMRIFGSEFESGWPILVIGTLGQLVNCGVGSVGYLLLMSGNQRRLFRVQLVMAGVICAMNLLLIPRWGITGAAIAAALSNILTNLWYLREVRNALGLQPYNRGYLRLVLPLALTCVALFGVRAALSASSPAWLLIAAGMVVAYLTFAGIVLLCGFDADDHLIASAIRMRLRGAFQGASA